jgi:predicted RND superfamily exporter protein
VTSTPAAKDSNYFVVASDGVEKWRTTAHVSALGSTDYGELLGELTSVLETQVLPAAVAKQQQVSLELSGLMPLVHEIQQQLLHDLFASFLVAFALIAVVMTIVQAGIVAGLLSMVPNVFPALTLFGLLGWYGHPIDVGSIMTASVAMGIAVDDTLHFLTFFQRSLDSGKSRRGAVLAAHKHCGRAIIQTTLICTAGLSAFAFSDFVPTARFAWMMVALLSAALVGDLIVLPSLLIGPLGRVFDHKSQEPSIVALPGRADSIPAHARKAG